jgi:hypothetical protein
VSFSFIVEEAFALMVVRYKIAASFQLFLPTGQPNASPLSSRSET